MNRILTHIFCTLFFMFSVESSRAQMMSVHMRTKEDTLKKLGSQMVNAEFAEQRFRADSHFTRVLVRALQSPFSFHYAFDSITSISRLYSPDSSFRIFSWQVSKDENTHRRHGAIQINTTDGSLKLFPLIDRSSLISNQQDTVSNNEWWIGSIYYKIIMNEYNHRKYYTLLGYDEFSRTSTRKRIEILYFTEKGFPVFGDPIFVFSQDSPIKKPQTRFWIEYKKAANASIKYDEDLGMILFDHLISESNQPDASETFVPDGDYEGFKWKDGKWMHVNKPFTFRLEDGQAPVEKPVMESKIPTKKSTKRGN